MMKELDLVVLREDIAEHGLRKGDVGTVVLVHEGGAGCEVEFVALDGETIAVATLESRQMRPAAHREIAHARSVAD